MNEKSSKQPQAPQQRRLATDAQTVANLERHLVSARTDAAQTVGNLERQLSTRNVDPLIRAQTPVNLEAGLSKPAQASAPQGPAAQLPNAPSAPPQGAPAAKPSSKS